jgi:hypothetical protein
MHAITVPGDRSSKHTAIIDRFIGGLPVEEGNEGICSISRQL